MLTKFSLHSNLVIFQFGSLCITWGFNSLYIPIWLYSNMDVQAREVQMKMPLHSNLVIFQYVPEKTVSVVNKLYIPIWLYSNRGSKPNSSATTSLHSNLVIFQWQLIPISSKTIYLDIPIWLYSNPSTIIPHIYRLWKLLFVDLRFLIHPNAIFFASYSYYLCLDPYYSGFVYLPIFKVYHRLTIILVQLMFYINLV